MTDEKPDPLTDQIAEMIGIEMYRVVAKLATEIAIDLAHKNTDKKVTKRDIYLRVANAFNKVTAKHGAEVIVATAPGIGRGMRMRVESKAVE